MSIVFVAAGGCARVASPRVPSPGQVSALEAEFDSRPNSTDARLHLAAAYTASGRPADAAELLDPVVATAKPEPAALFLYAVSLEKQQRFAQARAAFEQYLAIEGPLPLRRAATARIALLERHELEQAVQAAARNETGLAAATARDNIVGVFPFLVTGADPSLRPLGSALAELLTTDLAQTSRLGIVERARVQMLLEELRLARSGAVDTLTGARVGRIVGAGRIVQGRIDGDQTALRFRTLVVDASNGSAATPIVQDGSIDELFDMQKQLALSIYAAAGVQLTVAERERVLRRHTDNVQALLAFGFGLEADDVGHWAEAVEAFERALALDGDFELAQIWLQRARRKLLAADEDVDWLIGVGGRELGWWLPEWRRRRLLFVAVDPMVPDPDLRDPAPEMFGVEGLDRRARVDVIIRPPGGGQ